MGEGLLQFYQTKVKKEYKIAFISTFFITLFVHMYKFTNTLPNHDSILNYYSDQNILGSGRWALSLACGISSYFDLPWVIGLLSCLFIALTVVVIVAVLKLENPVLIVITGALIASAPATTETFFFLYTADGYMIAMLLSALAVYLSRIEEKRLSMWIVSGICICVSCGIYQAYVSFALILAVCYFINVLLDGNHNKKECIRWVFRQAIIYIVSLASYYIIWKACMNVSGIKASDYLGISEVGKVSIDLLIKGFSNMVISILYYILHGNVFEQGFNLYSILNIIFIVLFIIGLISAFLKSKIYKRKWAAVLFVFCLIAIVPFACIWSFTSENVDYRPMMLQSLTLLFVITALIYEKYTRFVTKNIIALFMTMVIFSNTIMANICYFYMNLSYERTYAESVEMMNEIHNLQNEFDFDKIAIIGSRINEVIYTDNLTEDYKKQIEEKNDILTKKLRKTLLYDSEHTYAFLENMYEMNLEKLNSAEVNELAKTQEVQSMPSWPVDGSITVIDNILVIKLSDVS